MPVTIRNEDSRPEQIAQLISETSVQSMAIWPTLDELSTHTIVDDIEVDPAGIVVENDGNFSGVFNIYVTLQYGSDDDDGFSTSDSFLAEFAGHYEDGKPHIDSIEVDTSSFYE